MNFPFVADLSEKKIYQMSDIFTEWSFISKLNWRLKQKKILCNSQFLEIPGLRFVYTNTGWNDEAKRAGVDNPQWENSILDSLFY